MASCKVLALTAKRTSESHSLSSALAVSVVSLSDAVMVRVVPCMSKQKQSKIGIVFFCTMTRPMVISREERTELDITNFMWRNLVCFSCFVCMAKLRKTTERANFSTQKSSG